MIVFGTCDSTTTSPPSSVTLETTPAKMGDVEDLNRTLYDIGAQDLLDVWDAMETENDANSNGNSLGIGNSGLSSMMLSLSNQQTGGATPVVLKDRLLTDSVVFSEDFPSMNATNNVITATTTASSSSSGSSEHSYSSGPSVSLAECQTTFSGPITKIQTTNSTNKICSSNATQMWGTAAGSDGDSMPESPLSLDDDMETECYPCIPMQSATNQKSNVMIKNEPLSEGEDDGDDEEEEDDNHFVNVVDDNEESTVNRQQRTIVTQIRAPSSSSSSSISGSRRANKKASMCQNSNSSNNNNYNSKFNVSLLATTNSNNIEQSVGSSNSSSINNNVFFVKKQSNVSYVSTSANPLIATVVTHNGETKVTPRTSSPLGSLLSTTSTAATAAGKVRMQQIQQQKCVRLTRSKHPQSLLKHQQPVVPAAQSSTTAILVTPISSGNILTTTSTGDKSINNGQLVNTNSFTAPTSSMSRGQNISSNNCSNGYITSSYSAPVNIGCLKIKAENDFVQPQSSGIPNTSNYNRAIIHSSLISNQPTDGTSGILYLTDEEKKTLMSEGYPIPTKLPLTKAEEKSLKKIRRKIKNKISAQESRRKKKEFVDTLEQKVSLASAEVDAYKKRCDLLQKQNASLMTQLNNLRAMLVNQSSASPSTCGRGGTNIISASKTISSNTLSVVSSNGIKTEPTPMPTNSIKIEPDCFDSVLAPGLDLD